MLRRCDIYYEKRQLRIVISRYLQINYRGVSLGGVLNESQKPCEKFARESPGLYSFSRAAPHPATRVAYFCAMRGNHGFIHAGSTSRRIWRASARICARVRECVRAADACVRLARHGRVNASISTFSALPNTIDVYRCALARKRTRAHARTHGRVDACAKVARRLRAEWHSRRVVPMRAACSSLCVNKPCMAHAHGQPRYNGCLGDTARTGEPELRKIQWCAKAFSVA